MSTDLLGTAPADLVERDDQLRSTREEARARAERIRLGLAVYVQTRRDIADAYARRDWKALGYDSWAEYLEAEFEITRLRLSKPVRREAVEAYRLAGMPTRAIGSAVGVTHPTVINDLQATGKSLPVDTVTGLDGRVRPATRPLPASDTTATPAGVMPGPGSGPEGDPGGSQAGPSTPPRAEGPATTPQPQPAGDPEERRQHEDEVRRVQDIKAARRAAKTIVTDVRSLVVTLVAGCRYGERDLVTPDMVRQLREAIDLLEGELVHMHASDGASEQPGGGR